MDQPIDFLFGGGDKSVEPHGGPSSDGGIGWHNIAGMVGGGGGCLGLMNKICRFLHQKSQCFGSVSFTPQKNLMVLIQILCFLFEFLLVHWYFQPFFPQLFDRYHLVGAVPASCHPRWGMVVCGGWDGK